MTMRYVIFNVGIIALFALILFVMGQPLICECGYIKFWHGPVVLTSENSQHITDWYTFSHIIHGFGFYWFLWLLGKRWPLLQPLGVRFVLALLMETSWEIFENTDFVINRYREVTISLDYYGDSIINAVGDVLAMMLGFVLAYRWPVWAIIAITIALELFVGYQIRDNLTLNIIMLIYPFDAILRWQQGGS
ncbi:MAG: DUF2585 domain-containing protein [Patescibacteria group bacterium]